ncbi:MAG: DUF502 domain-containing protein [Deltaproteobacteria bacterium]|nr:DUF502 domain-containing protein [Deltaproteobacteria bacterium]
MERIKGAVKKTFIAGLVTFVPITITVLALFWLFRLVDGILSPVFHEMLGMEVPGLGFLSTIGIIFVVGLLATNVLGSRILKVVQDALMRLPVVNTIYPTVKQLVEAFSPASSHSFKKVVLVEYPQKGILSMGFVTNELSLDRALEKTRLLSVYLPTNNLYLGQVALFPPSEVVFTGFSVEEGLRIILSGGTAFPRQIKSYKSAPLPVAEVSPFPREKALGETVPSPVVAQRGGERV